MFQRCTSFPLVMPTVFCLYCFVSKLCTSQLALVQLVPSVQQCFEHIAPRLPPALPCTKSNLMSDHAATFKHIILVSEQLLQRLNTCRNASFHLYFPTCWAVCSCFAFNGTKIAYKVLIKYNIIMKNLILPSNLAKTRSSFQLCTIGWHGDTQQHKKWQLPIELLAQMTTRN